MYHLTKKLESIQFTLDRYESHYTNPVGQIIDNKASVEDLAASVLVLYERELLKLIEMCPHENLVLMGGCALNCAANS